MNSVIGTYTGVAFNPVKPLAIDVRVADIAHALSQLPRFGGHTGPFYSVAQHSVLVSMLCDPDDAAHGLLHDAAEGYGFGDIPTPLKQHFPGLKRAERTCLTEVYVAFGLSSGEEKPGSVGDADWFAYLMERAVFMPRTDWWPALNVQSLNVGELLTPLEPPAAEALFLYRYNELLAAGKFKPLETV